MDGENGENDGNGEEMPNTVDTSELNATAKDLVEQAEKEAHLCAFGAERWMDDLGEGEEDEIKYRRPMRGRMTVYSKSGCGNCIKVKQLLQAAKIGFDVIDCDDWLVEDKDAFLREMQQWIGGGGGHKEWRTFPMIFDGSARFIGGYVDTQKYVEQLVALSHGHGAC